MAGGTAGGTGPLAGEPRDRRPRGSGWARAGAWLAWWIPLMGLWVALDDSLSGAELLAGVAAAAIGALVAEAACHQAALRFRLPAASAGPALRLPWRVAAETVTVYRALWRRLVHGESPRSGLVEVPVCPGAAGEDGVLRRTLLIGEQSLAPNSLALGIDADRGVMVMHRLVKGDQ